MSKAFARLTARLSISDLHFHDLRHDFATRLRRAGTGLDTLQSLLGHSSLSMVTGYAHIGNDEMRDAVLGLKTTHNSSKDH